MTFISLRNGKEKMNREYYLVSKKMKKRERDLFARQLKSCENESITSALIRS